MNLMKVFLIFYLSISSLEFEHKKQKSEIWRTSQEVCRYQVVSLRVPNAFCLKDCSAVEVEPYELFLRDYAALTEGDTCDVTHSFRVDSALTDSDIVSRVRGFLNWYQQAKAEAKLESLNVPSIPSSRFEDIEIIWVGASYELLPDSLVWEERYLTSRIEIKFHIENRPDLSDKVFAFLSFPIEVEHSSCYENTCITTFYAHRIDVEYGHLLQEDMGWYYAGAGFCARKVLTEFHRTNENDEELGPFWTDKIYLAYIEDKDPSAACFETHQFEVASVRGFDLLKLLMKDILALSKDHQEDACKFDHTDIIKVIGFEYTSHESPRKLLTIKHSPNPMTCYVYAVEVPGQREGEIMLSPLPSMAEATAIKR